MLALFTVRLPADAQTVPFTGVPLLMAEARHGPRESLNEPALSLFGVDWLRDESELLKAFNRGEVEVIDRSAYPIRPPVSAHRLEKAVMTVDALRRYLEGVNMALELADPKPKETPDQRRARLADWFHEEVKAKGERGAKQRVYERELALNPKADRSAVGKDIRQGLKDRGATGAASLFPFGQLVRAGKRQ